MDSTRKGQYTILEQVVLFALGISITVGFLFAFDDLRSGVKADMEDVQSELIAEYIASTSVDLVESGAEGRMEMPVPEEIASESYVVQAGDGAIRVRVAGEQDVSTLYGLASRLTVAGDASSREGAVSVTLDGSELEISEAE